MGAVKPGFNCGEDWFVRGKDVGNLNFIIRGMNDL
jgi:hypothetical protein